MADLWINNDGLVVRFGKERATKGKVASYSATGPRQFAEFILRGVDLPTSGTAGAAVTEVLSHDVRLPEGAVIESVEIVTTTEFTGTATPLLSVGIAPVEEDGVPFDLSGTDAADDFFVDEATIAHLNAGGVNTAAWVGDGVGDVVPTPSVVTVTVSTTSDPGGYTAGEATARVRWSVPVSHADTLVQTD